MTTGLDLQVVALVLGALSFFVSLMVLRSLTKISTSVKVARAVPEAAGLVPDLSNALTDDRQLVAVLTAAIMAYEADQTPARSANPAGFVIRKIRRV